jgi:hypothetical protein
MVNKPPLVNRVRLMLLCLAKRKYLSAESLLSSFLSFPRQSFFCIVLFC